MIDKKGYYAVIVDGEIYSIHNKRDEASLYAHRQFMGNTDYYEIKEVDLKIKIKKSRNVAKERQAV